MNEARDFRGRFRKGYCPNPAGRPGRRRNLPLPARLRRSIIDLANQPVVTGLSDGRKKSITLFENRVLGLVSASGGKRLACKAFIDLVLQAASQAQALDGSEGSAGVDPGSSGYLPEEGADEAPLSFKRWVETLPLLIRGLSDTELINRISQLGAFGRDIR